MAYKKGKLLTLRSQDFRIKKRQKKSSEIFGRNKRVTTFVAPKEREQELRLKEEGLKPASEICRIHKRKPDRVSIGK